MSSISGESSFSARRFHRRRRREAWLAQAVCGLHWTPRGVACSHGFPPQLGIDMGDATKVRTLPNWVDRRFLAATKVLLMPSLIESVGFAAMEAMLNGIPVLASNRGGLPETIGDASFLFDIPARYTPETREVPTVEEVEPWVETIVRLWDDAAECERWSHAARERAGRWRPERLAPIYSEFFGCITHQPGPPLVPKDVAAR